ncbi:MAG: alpha/beta hydrolase [Bryobacteraceae bacterium]
MILLILAAGLIAASLAYQAFGARRDRRRYPAPGRLIDAAGCRLHLNRQGAGKPAVVLEAGIAASSLSWALVQPEIAGFTCVCSYDRAGLGWSGNCSAPRTVQRMVMELRALLSRANVIPPYILVGHSFGGLLIRAFAHLAPGEVAGLVLVDPVALQYWANCGEDELRCLRIGARLSRRGAVLAHFGIVRAALAALVSGSRRFPKLVARASAGRGSKVMEGLISEVQKLPPEVWPMIRAHWSCPKCFAGMAKYLSALPENAQAALEMPIPQEIPLIILSASSATENELKERDAWVQQSERGRHIRVDGCGHWVQLERPDLVVAAIRELVELARGGEFSG